MNPELRRNVWLELTPHRLVAAPALLLAVFALAHLLSGERPLAAIGSVAWWLAAGVGVLWGARAASESVVSEVRAGTWDQQRLSSIEPWAMTWGKLLGAPVFPWVVCAPCLVLLAAGAATRMPLPDAAAHAVLMALILIFTHAIGLLASLHFASRSAIRSRPMSFGLHLVGLFVAGPLLLTAAPAYFGSWHGHVSWFAQQWPTRDFVLASTALWAGWAVLGCYRLMRAELALRNAPWVWAAFVAFAMLYAAGLAFGDARTPRLLIAIDGVNVAGASLLAAHLVALALGYGVLLFELKDPVALRRAVDALRRGDAATALEGVPRWLVVVPLAASTAGWAIAANSVTAVVCASALAFFVRDAGIVTLLNLGPRRERADTAALFYLLVLYGLAPALLGAALSVSPQGWLLPAVTGGVLEGLLPAAMQAVAVWSLAAVRWRHARTEADRALSGSGSRTRR